MPPKPICSGMGSAAGTSGTKPDSAEDTEDLSQEGEDTGECEVIAVGRIGGVPMCPSCPRISPSAYLELIFSKCAFPGKHRKRQTWRRELLARRCKTLRRVEAGRESSFRACLPLPGSWHKKGLRQHDDVLRQARALTVLRQRGQ
jgi:hypothetical protein